MEWEVKYYPHFFGMWLVRPVGDEDPDSLRWFHVDTEGTARALQALLSEAKYAVQPKFVE